MKVLSLFDGISCGALAFDRAGIAVSEYHTCEIDPYAEAVSKKNYPDATRHGDVRRFVPKEKFDFLIGGSPCQGFSLSGKQKGFDDARSALINDFFRILKECKEINPDIIFLLENVPMRRDNEELISRSLGVEPLMIDSALVSAQSRKRLYWINRAASAPLVRSVGAEAFDGDPLDRSRPLKHVFRLAPGTGSLNRRGYYSGGSTSQRVYGTSGMMPTLTVNNTGGNNPLWLTGDDRTAFRATPEFCEWLQTLPKGYTEGIPINQRYRAIGNAWTVDVIADIIKQSKKGVVDGKPD